MPSPLTVRPWHPPHIPVLSERAVVGRQGIFTRAGLLAGHELLYRAAGHAALPVDRWPPTYQDRATEHVIAVAMHRSPSVTSPHPAFVNFSRSYLLGHGGTMGCDPETTVIEVVESAHADTALVGRLLELRSLGFRLALDDFIGTTSQLTLLGMVDIVKVDVRDVVRQGQRLVDAARLTGATLIAERVEDAPMFDSCLAAGFDLFQGFLFEGVEVHDRGPMASQTLTQA